MRITAVIWGSYAPVLKRAARVTGDTCTVYPTQAMEQSPDLVREALESMRRSDVVLLYHTADLFWEEVDREVTLLRDSIPLVSLGSDPSFWAASTVAPPVVGTCHRYISNNGDENFVNLLLFIRKEILSEDLAVAPPADVPWEGLYHPSAPAVFPRAEEYRAWYSKTARAGAPFVGVLFSRTSWASGNVEIENMLIESLERAGLNVIPAFTYAIRDDALGARGMDEVVLDYFTDNGLPAVDAIVKLVPFLLGSSCTVSDGRTTAAGSGVGFFSRFGVPVFSPVITNYMTITEWQESKGLSLDISWAVALPEFEGVIEPVLIGTSKSRPDGDKMREGIAERCDRVAARVKNWIALAQKPACERRVAFLLNNNPCAGAEAKVGGGSNLDTLESVARILAAMERAGYRVRPPSSGKDLVDTILGKKAISEFRWTSAADIVSYGGTLELMDTDTYRRYFSSLPESVRQKVIGTWGEPPGQSMVHEGKILITGISYGNATVHVQPKRGCAGSRCDGQVCMILHDPECPPPHQYLATYYWLSQIQKADVIVHVGTHGNLEFLPGKGVGLSEECFPDVAIGSVPFLYIYNSDNPAEGTVAKRRSYATIVDHMQTVMVQGGLSGELEEIDSLLAQYETARHDPARAHALSHMLQDAIITANLDRDMHVNHDTPLDELVAKAHEALSRIRNTGIQSGMHVFGQVPEGEKRAEFIRSVIRFDDGEDSPRRLVAGLMGFDLAALLENQQGFSGEHGRSHGAIIEQVDRKLGEFIEMVLGGSGLPYPLFFDRNLTPEQISPLDALSDRILAIDKRIRESDETGSLLRGMDGRYIPAGPSGQITRGHEDVLPTGRNFYSLDPHRVPTRAAWRVGQRLGDAVIAKHVKETGAVPENVGFYWMAGDIMASDGEMFAQMLWLIGARPVWRANGQVKSFEIIPLRKLGHPRIDITVRTTGILRDNFSNCYELLDDAIRAVAALDEPDEKNFVRRHARQIMESEDAGFRDATYRIFSSKPGTYATGVNLAVLASAWKTQADLADIFVAWNGYAYGRDTRGTDAHGRLASNLSTVSVTFNKVHSDEHDLLGCCCYFGAHGGFTAAARHYSGHEVKPYYGDTREPGHVEVRDLSDEIRRVVRTKLLNPKWIDGMKEHGYKGASDIMKRVTRVYGWSASTQEVDDWIFNDIASTFVNDDEMRRFFEEKNPYALEEIARRLLEAKERDLWDADPDVLADLKRNYLEVESWMEDRIGTGDLQGGNVDVYAPLDAQGWGAGMQDLIEKVRARHNR